MKWISDKFDFLSGLIFSFGILGLACLIKSLVDIFRAFMARRFFTAESVITKGDIFILLVVIIGALLIVYKAYTSPKSMTKQEEKRMQIFYKAIIVLMLIATVLSYSRPIFLTVLFKVNTVELFMFGFVVYMTYGVIKKKLYN